MLVLTIEVNQYIEDSTENSKVFVRRTAQVLRLHKNQLCTDNIYFRFLLKRKMKNVNLYEITKIETKIT